MNRRTFATSASAFMAGAVAPAWPKDRPVYLNYHQAELKRAYTQTAWAPNAAERLQALRQESLQFRRDHPPREFAYGVTPPERLDVYAAAGASGAPIMIYIHGSGWRSLSKEDSAGEAPLFFENGIIYVVLNFALIPDIGLATMVGQVRGAIAWVYMHAKAFGGDPDRIHIWGASSGAHLAGVMLTTADWAQHGVPADVVKGALLLSGSYDLKPLVLSGARPYLVLKPGEVDLLSPMRHVSSISCPVIVAWGDRESPEYIRQGKQFALALDRRGVLGAAVQLLRTNHFEVTSHLRQPESPLSRAVLRQIKPA